MKNIKKDKNKKQKNLWITFIKLYEKNEEILNYIIVGGLTTLISLLTYYILVLTILNPNNPIELQLANITSWITSVTFAYFANRIFVFKSKSNNKLKEASKFVTGRIGTLLIDMFTMFIFVSIFKLNDKMAKLLVQIIVLLLNYLISKIFVFKK